MNVTDLLERRDTLHALETAAARAAGGAGSTVLVEGPAGIGKTSVVEAFVAQQGARVLVARCTPLSRTVTAGVARDWLTPLAQEAGFGQPPFDGPAARLTDPTLAAGDVAWAVTWVLDDLLAQEPLVLVVDDLHWADAASLAVLDHLAAGMGDRALLLVATLRSGEPTAADEHVKRIRALADSMVLAPLTSESAARLVGDLPDDVASAVVARGAGNPLFLRELAAAARRGDTGVPESLVDLVGPLLQRLPDQAIAVARACAVLGAATDLATIAAVAAVDPQDVTDTVALLVRAHLLAADGDLAAPAHPLVGEAVLRSIPAAERTDLHRSAARVLRRAGARERDVAAHLLRTTPTGDPEVRRLLTDAGERAVGAQSRGLAVDYLQRAAQEDDEPPLALMSATARALAADSQIDRAMTWWRRARTTATDPEAAAMTMAEAGDALLAAGRMEEAVEVWESELRRLDTGSEAAKAIASRIALGASILRGAPSEFEESLHAIATQDPGLDSHGDRLILAAASVGAIFAGDQTAATASALAARSWAGGRLLAEETAAGSPLYLVTATFNWTDSFTLGLEVLDAAIVAARSMTAEVLGTAAYCRCYVRMRQGDLRGAVDDMELAFAMRRLGWDAYTPSLLQNAVEIKLSLGDLEGAKQLSAELRDVDHEGKVFYAAYRAMGVAQIALAMGDLDTALTEIDTLRQSPAAINPAMLDWRSLQARIHLARGDERAARETSDELLGLARAFGAPRLLASALVTQSLVEPGAAQPLREALALTDVAELHLTRERAEAALLLAERTAGAEAVSLAQMAHGRAAEEGMEPLRARALAVLRDRGIDPHREASAWDVLSPAERRVVEAVLTGMTNREAANHLFLTVKAIEWHLSSTYRKLGIRGRPGLPGALGR